MGAADERRRQPAIGEADPMELLRPEAEDFLYLEADLLDKRAYDDWLKLFTRDGIYWLPMDEGGDPLLESSVLYDDTKLREMRIHQLVRKLHYAQHPRSRTVHAVTNVRVGKSDRADEALVRCTTMVAEMREGDYLQLGLGEQRLFAGHCEYRLRRDGNGALAIALKKFVLMNRDTPIVNLSFIL
jgi:3-phenylpropionate/cinnamic acid dioxygenase small subunit